jgi:signal transduction histidine kinase
MTDTGTTGGAGRLGRAENPFAQRALVVPLRGFAHFFMTIPQVVVFSLTVTAIGLLPIGLGLLVVPPMLLALRAVANVSRGWAARWDGVDIPRPYRPEPVHPSGARGMWHRTWFRLADPATWRDLLWALLQPILSSVLALMPAYLILEGIFGLLMPALQGPIVSAGGTYWYVGIPVDGFDMSLLCVPAGLVLIGLGLAFGPRLQYLHARWLSVLLSPAASARLTERVEDLTRTRTEAVDAQAAELRRIERDLHDGAQARLVAMGMNLGAAEALLATDPEAARKILTETREASAKALNELRDLVRGIHPPVLADRGLGDAVRALALESPLEVEVSVDLPGRLEAPVESAAYFAMSEMLTNAAKHSGATRVRVELRHHDGLLRMVVEDDGRGGADESAGSGVRGIRRRLGTFDGTLALTSPRGGPTTVVMELPCVLSSPKTSPS